jgi:hypothetical protein
MNEMRVLVPEDLTRHADIALAEHVAVIRALGKRVVRDIIEIGGRLTECKNIVGHGGWLPWLEREFGWSERAARNFMQAHELSLKSANFADLDVPVSALYLLAAPSTPGEVVDAAVDRAANGEKLTVEQVKDMIAEARKDEGDKYEKRLTAAQQRYEGEVAKLRADLGDQLSPEALQAAIDDALAPLQRKIKALEEERDKRNKGAPVRQDEFGLKASRIENALRDLAAALTISAEQVLQHEQIVADATHRTLDETTGELMAHARIAHAWLRALVKE